MEKVKPLYIKTQTMQINVYSLKCLNASVFSNFCSGKMVFKTKEMLNLIKAQNLVCLSYTDETGHCTEEYPLNPNGSVGGIAGICSPDGRHLAMMPHPERCFMPWQWPWMPENWKRKMKTSPWMRLFQNAYRWCQTDVETQNCKSFVSMSKQNVL